MYTPYRKPNSVQTTPKFKQRSEIGLSMRYRHKNNFTEISSPSNFSEPVYQNKAPSNEILPLHTEQDIATTSSNMRSHYQIETKHVLSPENNFNFPLENSKILYSNKTNMLTEPQIENDVNIKELIIPQIKKELDKTVHLIGTVEYVIQWYQLVKQKINASSTFQVIGWLECTKQGKYSCQKLLFIRGEGGSILQGIYYEIDRVIPHLYRGQLLSCTGRMIGANKLHIYDIQVLNDDDRIAAHRVIFLSQQAVNKIAAKKID